ncbi:MAG: molybdopterin molybdotransferase MoeA [Chloroflexi bacterium]|nr:molybdopterin molybdotransferase MoeA [Chloroflexota bacterium]
MPEWLSVEEALDKVLGYVHQLEPEQRPLLEALGQVLAEEVAAGLDVPPKPNSSMDGYAVQAADIRGASPGSPVALEVVGQLAAGEVPSQEVKSGVAIRIMTGALIPPGADAVVPFEETDELQSGGKRKAAGDRIKVLAELPHGANVRPQGEDIRRGEVVLRAGAVLRPAEIGVLASMGYASVRVVRRPVVAVLSTGDELVEPPEALPPGKIYNSNSYSIAASVLKYGGIPKQLGIARDNLPDLERCIQEGLDADMLVTTAGVSRGDYDIVKDVLMKQGEIAFWTVRMKPAKPLAFGALRATGRDGSPRRVPHLGLPGNPVSAMVAFESFGRPAILKMMGRRDLARPTVRAVLEDDIENTDERRVYARAWITKREGTYYARLTGPQGSGVLTSMVKANGLAICPEDVPLKRAGETVDVMMLDWTAEQL